MRDLSRGMMGLDICIKGKQNVFRGDPLGFFLFKSFCSVLFYEAGGCFFEAIWRRVKNCRM